MAKTKTYKGKSLQLGGGGRFAQLRDKLARKGVENPDALAAKIGRQKYGAEQMAEWAAAGRRRSRKKKTTEKSSSKRKGKR